MGGIQASQNYFPFNFQINVSLQNFFFFSFIFHFKGTSNAYAMIFQIFPFLSFTVSFMEFSTRIFHLQIANKFQRQYANCWHKDSHMAVEMSSLFTSSSFTLSIYSYLFGTFFMNIKRFSMIDKYRYLSMILLFFIAVSFNVCKLITFNNLGITIHFYELRTFLISFFHIYFHLRPIKPLAI